MAFSSETIGVRPNDAEPRSFGKCFFYNLGPKLCLEKGATINQKENHTF